MDSVYVNENEGREAIKSMNITEAIKSMDIRASKNNRKSINDCDGEGKNEGNITICDLPDPILELIISNLSVGEAVRTSVLSKRWLYLWRGISKIELREGAREKRQQFIDFVRKLLLVCDCSNLEKLDLWCDVGDDASLFNECLWRFINAKIKELHLSFSEIKEPLVFPDHLFTCATLTNFVLCMPHVLNLPSSIRFESLRTLSLVDITFPNCSLTQHILSFRGCPLLQELFLLDCNWVNVKSVIISFPKLQDLTIHDSYDVITGGQNVSGLCEIGIVGTTLKSFSYEGFLENDFFLCDLTSVINASIRVNIDWERSVAFSVFTFLHELRNVEKLTISEMSLLDINQTTNFLPHLPMFCNLAEIHVEVDEIESPICLCCCESLLTIFRNSPCLQVIHFDMGGVGLHEDCVNNSNILDLLPICFKTHLKTIKMFGFSGSEDELYAIKILLQAASVLDTLYVCFYSFFLNSPMDPERFEKLWDKIEEFPRASIDCKMILEYS